MPFEARKAYNKKEEFRGKIALSFFSTSAMQKKYLYIYVI
jgi:hypothetical protein